MWPVFAEHVACAGVAPVLSAGEITFSRDQGHWTVSEVSNQSAGYCPDPASWPAVNDALDRVGLEHPGRFAYPVVFRRCPRCQERNLVKDDYFACVICGAELPPDVGHRRPRRTPLRLISATLGESRGFSMSRGGQ